ncbi:sigma factor [Pseudoroseicyclus sp. CXY001]|uniref:sigma factor n=1 Tax=Pseudoroseicyclus sp. CXY001 TaxID=3242492 RepID=UPI0035715272
MSALTPAHRGRLLALARRHARRAEEAEDLVQEALVAAHEAGRLTEADLPWIAGVIRRQAAMAARGAGRRRAREIAWAEAAAPDQPPETGPLPPLPPALAQVARLAAAGCTRAEIRWLLGLTDTALRQRLSALRRQLAGRPRPPERPGAGGALRPALGAALARRPEALFASHDPDGHFFLVSASRNRPPRQHPGETT